MTITQKKRALITGINGMDGSHLADFLLEKGYEVYGMERRTSSPVSSRDNVRHIEGKINIIKGDLADQSSLLRCIKESSPDEIYNLAAQSFVGESWNIPEQTSNVTGLGVLRMLEAIREYEKPVKFYQASSSEMFGNTTNLQYEGNRTTLKWASNENTPFYPRSPYGVAKLYGHWICKNYRESYNMFNCSGILFNHESERRGHDFVTRKISDGVAKIQLGLSDKIALGNLDASRDWGYAPDYVEAMWLMLQHEKPDDFVIATGKSHTIRQFLDEAFNVIGVSNWKKYIVQDPKYMRPAEVDVLRGDSSKAKRELCWEPKVSFREMVTKMVMNDIEILGAKLK